MTLSVHDWLAGLQKQCFFPDEIPASFRQTNEELVQIKEKVLPHLTYSEQEIIRPLPVALLSLKAANAHAFRLPQGGCGICFDDTFVATMRVLNTLIVYQGSLIVPLPETASMLASLISAFSAPSKRTLRNVLRDIFIVLDKPVATAKSTHDPELLALVETAVGVATYWQHVFLLGHEFAHVLCGHLDEHRTVVAPMLTNAASDSSLELYKILQKDEQEADEKAALLLCQVLPKEHLEHAYHFIDAMFELLSTVEKIWEDHAVPLAESHPPASERQAGINAIVARTFGQSIEPGGYGYVFEAAEPHLKDHFRL